MWQGTHEGDWVDRCGGNLPRAIVQGLLDCARRELRMRLTAGLRNRNRRGEMKDPVALGSGLAIFTGTRLILQLVNRFALGPADAPLHPCSISICAGDVSVVHSAINVNTGTSVLPYLVKQYSTRSQRPHRRFKTRNDALTLEFTELLSGYLAARLRQRAESSWPNRSGFAFSEWTIIGSHLRSIPSAVALAGHSESSISLDFPGYKKVRTGRSTDVCRQS
jgi:hypothetical protein